MIRLFMDESGQYNAQTGRDSLLVLGLRSDRDTTIDGFSQIWLDAWAKAGDFEAPDWREFHAVELRLRRPEVLFGLVARNLLEAFCLQNIYVGGVVWDWNPTKGSSDCYLDFLLEAAENLLFPMPITGNINVEWHVARKENLDTSLLSQCLRTRINAERRRRRLGVAGLSIDVHVYDVNLHPMLVFSDLLNYVARSDHGFRALARLKGPSRFLSLQERLALRGRALSGIPSLGDLSSWLETSSEISVVALTETFRVYPSRLSPSSRVEFLNTLVTIATIHADETHDYEMAGWVLDLLSKMVSKWKDLLSSLDADALFLSIASVRLAIGNHCGNGLKKALDLDRSERLWRAGYEPVVALIHNRLGISYTNVFEFEAADNVLSPLIQALSGANPFTTFARTPDLGRLLGSAAQVQAMLAHATSNADLLEKAEALFLQASECFTDSRDLERQETYLMHLAMEAWRLTEMDNEEVTRRLSFGSSERLVQTFLSGPVVLENYHATFRVWALLKARAVVGMAIEVGEISSAVCAALTELRELGHPFPLIAGYLLLETSLPSAERAALLAFEEESCKHDNLIGLGALLLRAERRRRSGDSVGELRVPETVRGGWLRYGYDKRWENMGILRGGALIAPFNFC